MSTIIDTRPDVATTPLPLPPPTSRRSRRGGYLLAAFIAVVGVALAAVWGVTAYASMQGHIDDFARTGIPGRVTVDVASPGGRVIYYEGVGEMPLVALDVKVVGPDGDAVHVGTYGADLRYDAPGGQVGHAVGTFDATSAGSYVVVSEGSAPVGATLAVGESIPASTFVAIIGATLLALAALGTAVVVAIVTAVRRR
jgi:hypothetical protein